MTPLQAAKTIVNNLNDRSGITIDCDEDIMLEIYGDIVEIIGQVK